MEEFTSDRVTAASDQGGRSYQQDRFVVCRTELSGFGDLLIVLDGHGDTKEKNKDGQWINTGDLVAEKAREFIPAVLDRELSSLKSGNAAETKESFSRIVLKALEDFSKSIGKQSGRGSTMSLVYIPDPLCGGKVVSSDAFVAVLGDSPVIILDEHGEIVISPEHNVRSNQKEREAAEARGGVIQKFYGSDYLCKGPDSSPYSRVSDRGVQLSRVLGDNDLDPAVSHEPEIYSVALGTESLIIVGSDGLFDPSHLESVETEATRFLEMVMDGAEAKDLVQDALDRATGDNVTAIVWRNKEIHNRQRGCHCLAE